MSKLRYQPENIFNLKTSPDGLNIMKKTGLPINLSIKR